MFAQCVADVLRERKIADASTETRAQGSALGDHGRDSQRKDRGGFQRQGRKDAFKSHRRSLRRRTLRSPR